MQIAGTRIPLWIVVADALSLSVIAVWPCVGPTSFMAFDDPASHRMIAPHIYVVCALTYPILPIT